MKNIGLKETGEAKPEVDTGLLEGWLDRTDLARELTLSVDTLQRWETRRIGPPCVRVGRKVLYRMEAVRELACLVQGRFDRARWQRCIRGREDWKEISIPRFLSFNRFKMNEDE